MNGKQLWKQEWNFEHQIPGKYGKNALQSTAYSQKKKKKNEHIRR